MNDLFRSLAVLVAIAAAAPFAAAQDPLSLVPANAVTVGMVRLAEMRTSPLSSILFEQMDRMSADGEAERFLREAGLRPLEDVDALVVATSPRTPLGSEPEILVIAEGRFQPGRLIAALVARGAVDKGTHVVFPASGAEGDGENGAVAFLSPSLAIAGHVQSVVNALQARAHGGTGFASRGALAVELARIDRRATAWALIDVARAARLANVGTIDTGSGQAGAAFKTAVKSVSSVSMWARDTGGALHLGASGLSNDAETLELLEDTLRGALAAMRLAVSEKAPEMVPVLRGFVVDRKSGSITVKGSIPGPVLRDLIAKKLAVAAK
jgi:hypothetical protein